VAGTGSGFRRGGGGGGEMCALTCVTQMAGSLQGESSMTEFNTKNQLPYRFNDRFNPVQLGKFCSVMNTTIDCVQPCSGGQGKQMADAVLTLARFVCVDSFMRHVPCIHGVNKEQKSACDSKCSSEKSTLERTMTRQPSTMRDIQDMLGQTCEYMDCDTDCDYAKVSQKCGVEAAKAYVGYFKKSIDSAKSLFDIMGLQIPIPSSCNNVGVGDD
jgi:hypothetical protein